MATSYAEIKNKIVKQNAKISLSTPALKQALEKDYPIQDSSLLLAKLMHDQFLYPLNEQVVSKAREAFGHKAILQYPMLHPNTRASGRYFRLNHHKYTRLNWQNYSGIMSVIELPPGTYPISGGNSVYNLPLPWTYLLVWQTLHPMRPEIQLGKFADYIKDLLKSKTAADFYRFELNSTAKTMGIYFAPSRVLNTQTDPIYRSFFPNQYSGAPGYAFQSNIRMLCSYPHTFTCSAHLSPVDGKAEPHIVVTPESIEKMVQNFALASNALFAENFNNDNINNCVRASVRKEMHKRAQASSEEKIELEPYKRVNSFFELWERLSVEEVLTLPKVVWGEALDPELIFGNRKSTRDRKRPRVRV